MGWRLGQPIGLHPHEEARAEILCEAEELVDVTFAIGHMDAALRRTQQRRRLAQVLEPAVTLFGFDRHARWVHMSSERVRSLELGSCPELYRRQAKRCAREGDRQARMHQHAAQGEHVGLSGLVASAIDRFGEANLAWPLAAVDELCQI